MSLRRIVRVALAGPVGRLEGLLHEPEAAPRFAAVVSHPHPLHGGTMDNKVAYRVARALEDAGGLVLRFNFRGAGSSEGVHDRGLGEQDDLRAAAAFVRERAPGLPLILGGFSFGSVVSTRVAVTTEDVRALLLVGAPVLSHDFAQLPAFGRPVACIQGSQDQHGPLARLDEIWALVPEPKRLVVLEGANHFFDEHQRELAEAVSGLAPFLLG